MILKYIILLFNQLSAQVNLLTKMSAPARCGQLTEPDVCCERGEDVDLAGLLRTSKVTGADFWDTFKIFPQLKRKISADFLLDGPPL